MTKRKSSVTQSRSKKTKTDSVVTAYNVVADVLHQYKPYFRNPHDSNDRSFDPDHLPVVHLEYPNTDTAEQFLLLAPKDKDHYNPILCLQKSLHTIIEYYLDSHQRRRFGSLPTHLNILTDISPPSSPPLSPSPSPPPSPNSGSSYSSALSSPPSSVCSSTPPVNYLKAVQRAIHLCDGPLFLKSINAINALLRELKSTKSLTDIAHLWTPSSIPNRVILRIVDETYQRTVGPNVQALRNYAAFSSAVYGELMPPLITHILATTGLNNHSLLLDLGSGVGNVVLQASLETGCTSYGIELMPAPAKVAREQLEQFKIRCRMWCVPMGEVELEEGDMLKSARVNELIPRADVVLVNNKVFQESLNEALRPKFLDLKEGAMVVSLKPFVSSLNARVTERNVDDMSAIFDVKEYPYCSGSVSWGCGGGSYYVHRVAREDYASIRQKLETSRASSRSRRTKRRR